MAQSIVAIIPIIVRYHKLATRLASMQLQNKALASIMVTHIFEELFEEQKLYEGPLLRQTLIMRIRCTCLLINKLSGTFKNLPSSPLYQFPFTKN